MPGLPPQVMCYERADDIGFGVSGVVTRRARFGSFPDLIPRRFRWRRRSPRRSFYLLDPRRQPPLAALCSPMLASERGSWRRRLRRIGTALDAVPAQEGRPGALDRPVQPVGGAQLMATGTVQIWPGTPVAQPLLEDKRRERNPARRSGRRSRAGIRTRALCRAWMFAQRSPWWATVRWAPSAGARPLFGLPEGNEQREWALGMKMVVDLPETRPRSRERSFTRSAIPEPEIFGFLYVHPGNWRRWASSFRRGSTARRARRTDTCSTTSSTRTCGGISRRKLRSWGAKSLQESGRRGEPFLVATASRASARLGQHQHADRLGRG